MPQRSFLHDRIYPILMIYILLVAAYLRFNGIFWGEYQYLHPDERFLIWVGTDISPVKTFSEYWDTANSSLNPHNRGHGFYVYGTLPMFITRYLVEWIYGHSGFQEMTNVGRVLSALFDLSTVFLVYLVASLLFDRRVGILASAFSALAVLQIQHAHFFTMDTFTTFFALLTVYFAIKISLLAPKDSSGRHIGNEGGDIITKFKRLSVFPYFGLCIGFGVALGMATASKVNAAPLAFLLPMAFLLHYIKIPERERSRFFQTVVVYLFAAAITSLLVFRICQPYAFTGPGFWGFRLNPAWLANLKELQNQTSGDVDFPPAIQWTRRPVWFAWQNMVLWGMGLPLGLIAWMGFLWTGWRILKGEWKQYLVLWSWTGFYFTWQSLVGNPSMRYQLLVYPTLAIFAAWCIFYLYDRKKEGINHTFVSNKFGLLGNRLSKINWNRLSAVIIGGLVLITTGVYAFAFVGIYQRPITRVEASRWIYQNVPGPINLLIQTDGGLYNQPNAVPNDYVIKHDLPLLLNIVVQRNGTLSNIYLPKVEEIEGNSAVENLRFVFADRPDFNEPLAVASLLVDLSSNIKQSDYGYMVEFDHPISLSKGKTYYLKIELQNESGAVVIKGTTIANEGAWDDPLPLRLDGYDAFGGIYEGLNFDMYEDDNPAKLARFVSILDQAEYIFISSSRQWGSLPRLPERFPMNIEYYRRLIGCPENRTVEWCYSVAMPGDFQGELGFELVKVFQSPPTIGKLTFNDQFAEEAFTVYDHPKVFIFKKRDDYSPRRVREILGAVDLSQVIHVTPKEAESLPPNYLLPSDRLSEQRSGGTWSDLFDTQAIHNRYPLLALVLWYLVLLLLGLLTYPIIRPVFIGLEDKGYPLTRIAGLLILSYLVWLACSFRIPFQRLTITLAFLMVAVCGLFFASCQRKELRREWNERKGYFFAFEGLFLLFFLVDVLIRLGNPDLWHPWKGGEKPMDFSYFNAILKSTSFPPYDPWFAGGYINYYYYGFVLVGVLVKWLGIVPSIAINLIIPTIFAMIALSAFSVGWNLINRSQGGELLQRLKHFKTTITSTLFIPGIASALSVAVLGNLGTLRMIYHGYQRLVAPGGSIDNVNILTHWIWAIQGFIRALLGTPLPYGLADWYWNPSRAIPAPNDVEPITEFPFFTVLYADPHAHLFSLPLTILALAWILSVVLSKGWQMGASGKPYLWMVRAGFGLLFGGLTVGVLRPTNTWDLPTYLLLGSLAVGYTFIRYSLSQNANPLTQKFFRQRVILALLGMLFFVFFSLFLFQPYAHWYVQGYTAVDLWRGTHTPFWSYLTHWGLFLFIIIFWLGYETYVWMASTPISFLRKIEGYKPLIIAGCIFLLLSILILSLLGVRIAWLVILLMTWASLLILQSGMSDAKRFTLTLVVISLLLTLMVEVIVLRGDIGRMNTVFKFYLQSWTMLAISASAAFVWVLSELPSWNPFWRSIFRWGVVVLVVSAALYPLLATMAKVKDRMALNAPHTLDGMAFMEFTTYNDLNTILDLSQDYRAIRWMQENIKGSPVIIEANMVEYHWGTRFTIYTGLPNVIGWNWHQRQQRASWAEDLVPTRVNEVNEFYLSSDLTRIKEILLKYDIRYIIVGQLERAYYPGPGLDKFEQLDGYLWRSVYRDGDTVIYEAIYTK